MALKITITDAGRAALINATQSGTRAVSIVSVGISGTSITADKSATVLPDEIKRISTISGKVTALDAIHLTAKDDGSDVYTIRSFALYLDDGTLFAIYGQSSPILEKSAAAMLLLQLDIRFVDVDATQIQFGNLDFINPAATEKTAGVTRLTALGEAEQSTESIAVSPVELRRYAEKLARTADVLASIQKLDDAKVNRGGDIMTGSLRVMETLTVDQIITAHAMLHLISGNGQNALDIHSDDDGIARMYAKNGNTGYQQFLAFNPQGNLDFNSPTGQCLINGQLIWNKNNDGAGSGLDADFWRGLSPAALQRAMYDFNDDENAGWMFHPSGIIEMWMLTPYSQQQQENFRINYPRRLSKIISMSGTTEIEAASPNTDQWYQLFDPQLDSIGVQKQSPYGGSTGVRTRCRIRITGRL